MFKENVKDTSVNVLLAQLESVNSETCDIDVVNSVASDISNIMLGAAVDTFGTFHRKSYSKNVKRENKPWFDNECWQARKLYRLADRKHRQSKTQETKRENLSEVTITKKL